MAILMGLSFPPRPASKKTGQKNRAESCRAPSEAPAGRAGRFEGDSSCIFNDKKSRFVDQLIPENYRGQTRRLLVGVGGIGKNQVENSPLPLDKGKRVRANHRAQIEAVEIPGIRS